jgi:hypothetical protein
VAVVDQTDPISPNEYILRRVPYNSNNKLIDPDSEQPASRDAFRPTDMDTDGLSVSRELFVSAEQVAQKYTEENPGKQCWVVRVRARDLFDDSIGVSMVPDPVDDELPGHAIIPEINATRRTQGKDEKNLLKELQHKVARLVTRNDIIYWPDTNT